MTRVQDCENVLRAKASLKLFLLALSWISVSKMLVVKTLGGAKLVKEEPNGGYGWMVVFSAFLINGIAWGTVKNLGVFFVSIKDEFEISNAATSWLLTLMMSSLSFSGLIAKNALKWLDARVLIVGGGVVAGLGMLGIYVSSHITTVYASAVLSGVGLGSSFVISLSQVALYFSTWRPLANGIVLTGATILGSIYPYLNQFLLDEYGWRGAFMILGGIELNNCVLGALIHPISAIQQNKDDMSHTRKHQAPPLFSEIATEDTSRKSNLSQTRNPFCKFLIKYWLAFCLLLTNVLLVLSVYIPNIYLVAYAKELHFDATKSVLLLAFLSTGDFVGRLVGGLSISKISFFNSHILFLISFSICSISISQFIPIYSTHVFALLAYVVMTGFFSGIITTSSVTAVSLALPAHQVATGISALFASGGLGVLASGPLSGIVVDGFGSYLAAFWYTMICMGIAGSTCFLVSAIAQQRGGVVLNA